MSDPKLATSIQRRAAWLLTPGARYDLSDPTNEYGHGFVEVRIDDQADRRRSPPAVIAPAVDRRGAELDKP